MSLDTIHVSKDREVSLCGLPWTDIPSGCVAAMEIESDLELDEDEVWCSACFNALNPVEQLSLTEV